MNFPAAHLTMAAHHDQRQQYQPVPCTTHTATSHSTTKHKPTCLACSLGCWWQWDLSDDGNAGHWTLLVQGAEPCTGFQVMHSSASSAQTTDITHMAVQLPNLARQSLKQKMHGSFRGAEDTEGRQTWLVRTSAPGLIKLWLDGAGASKSVEATAEVCSVMIAARLVIKGTPACSGSPWYCCIALWQCLCCSLWPQNCRRLTT